MTRQTPSPSHPTGPYDVAIIGAGLGGLSCAVALARQGLKVIVFEQHHVAGGYAHNFRRKGYTFDVSLHHVGGMDPGNLTHGLLAGLGVLDKLELCRKQELFGADFPDQRVVLPNDRQAVQEELSRLFPAEARSLDQLFRFLPQLKNDVMGPTFDGALRGGDYEQRLSAAHINHTFGDLLETYVRAPRLLALLGQFWQYLGLPPSRATATYATCIFCSSFLEGAYHIRGGGQALSQAFVRRLEELGGTCLTRHQVAGIVVDQGKAQGVKLANGDYCPARRVVSAVNPMTTFFQLLPEDSVSKVLRQRLHNMECSLSIYALYLGLDCAPDELGLDQDTWFVNHRDDLDDAYQRTCNHDIDRTDWCVSNYNRHDPGMAPPGGSFMSIAELTPPRDWFGLDKNTYRRRKAETKQRLLDKYEQRLPGLHEHTVVEEFATPRTMARYTANYRGAIYGWAQTVSQSNSRRLRNRTPLKGLFLTGAWTWMGGGYEGALMTGVQSAEALLQDLDQTFQGPLISLAPSADQRPQQGVTAPAAPLVAPSHDSPPAPTTRQPEPEVRTMSLGKFLLTKENLELVKRNAWQRGRPQIIEQGLRYYEAHPDQVQQVAHNLQYMGLPAQGADLDEVLHHIIAHYYEKLFGLTKRYEVLWIGRHRIELGDSLDPFLEARETGKAVFIAESHFGGTYLLPAIFMDHGIETHFVGRFPEPVSSLFQTTVAALVERYELTPIHLLDVDDREADIPFQMMSLLMRGGVVSNVFDEPNRFSQNVKLLGRTIRGGSGMDLILKRFAEDRVTVVTPFLIRTSDDTFRLEVDRHSLTEGDLVASLYRSLEKRLHSHYQQWYFIHELHEAFPEPSSRAGAPLDGAA